MSKVDMDEGHRFTFNALPEPDIYEKQRMVEAVYGFPPTEEGAERVWQTWKAMIARYLETGSLPADSAKDGLSGLTE